MEINNKNLDYLGDKEVKLKGVTGKVFGNIETFRDFYLASPCFAKARLWVADCNNYTNECSLSDAKNGVCERCLFVSLERAYGLKYRH